MRRLLSILMILLFTGSFLQAQRLKVVKPTLTKSKPRYTRLAFGAGITRGSVYLTRNVKSNNDATGFKANIVYGGARLVRTSFEITTYKRINIEPTWYNVRALTLEANVHFLARFKSRKAVFYPLFGLSYNVFEGFFTGQNDYLNLQSVYKLNRVVRTVWVGLNAGVGYEYYFKPGSFFLDYKMRVGMTDGTNQLNIMDVCFSAGLRINMRAPSVYNIFKGTRSRYVLHSREID
jgi:hypothetical protein